MWLLLYLSCSPLHRAGQQLGAGMLTSLADPEHPDRVNPELQQAAQALGRSLVSGALDGLDDDARREALTAQSTALVRALSPELSRALGEEIGPALQEQLSLAVLQAVSDLQASGDLETMAYDISQALVRGLTQDGGPAMARVLEQDLGPAMQRVLEHNLSPVLQADGASFASEATTAASAALTEQLTVAMQGALGQAIEDRSRAVISEAVQGADAQSEKWQGFFWTALYGLLALMASGIIGSWALLKQYNRSRGYEAALDLVTTNIKRSERHEVVREMTQRIRDEGKDTAGGAALSEYLGERKHSKIEVRELGETDEQQADKTGAALGH